MIDNPHFFLPVSDQKDLGPIVSVSTRKYDYDLGQKLAEDDSKQPNLLTVDACVGSLRWEIKNQPASYPDVYANIEGC